MEYLISIIIGYLFGCIQTSYFLGHIVGKIDIRKHGSNNAGASNTVVVLGWKYGILVAIIDILKAAFAVWFINMLPLKGDYITLSYLAGLGAVLGHIFPFFMGFKGGKGTASVIGMFIAIDIRIALITSIILVVLTLITNYIVVGSLVMFILFPILSYYFGYGINGIIISSILLLIALYKHRINIIRIYNKEEIGLRKVVKYRQSKNNSDIEM